MVEINIERAKDGACLPQTFVVRLFEVRRLVKSGKIINLFVGTKEVQGCQHNYIASNLTESQGVGTILEQRLAVNYGTAGARENHPITPET